MNADWLDKVRARAYTLWESFGRPEGDAERHWVQAEEELRASDADATNPGDEATSGTPSTGEDICPACNGAGMVEGKSCPNCGGGGKVISGIGGA